MVFLLVHLFSAGYYVLVILILLARCGTFDAKKCEEMFAQGKRNLLCGEVPQSVNQLQEVCRLLYVCIHCLS